MNQQEQKLIIETLVSSSEVFSRCIGILKPEYFDREFQQTINHVIEYYGKYSNIPSLKSLQAKFPAMKYEDRGFIPTSEEQSTCDEVEFFCKQRALYSAVKESMGLVNDTDVRSFEKVLQLVQQALEVSLSKDIGIDMYDNPYERLKKLSTSQIYEPCGIKGIDDPLGGGFARKQFTLFSANSGGGKSIMLANIGSNYAKKGYHVLLLSLELSEEMIFLRNSAIMTGYKAKEWKDNIDGIADHLEHQRDSGAGSFIIKRIPNGSSANDIKSYLKQYEVTFKRKPDVIIVDYLDLMVPNGGVKNMGVSEQDKLKSEQLAEVGHMYNAIVLSASQQNREALRMASPDQGVIAGGITKVNTVDNYISIFMDPKMRLQGEMMIYFLKTRSSSAVGSSMMLSFNADNLQIHDQNGPRPTDIMNIPSKKRSADSVLGAVIGSGVQLPGMDDMTADDLMENGNESSMFIYDDPKNVSDEDTPPWDTEEKVKPVVTEVKAEKKPLQIVDDIPEEAPLVKKRGLKLDNGNDGDLLMSLMTSMS